MMHGLDSKFCPVVPKPTGIETPERIGKQILYLSLHFMIANKFSKWKLRVEYTVPNKLNLLGRTECLDVIKVLSSFNNRNLVI